MSNAGDNIRKSIIKRQEAIDRFLAKKNEFFRAKELISKDIEDAGNIWKTTLEQLPKPTFN